MLLSFQWLCYLCSSVGLGLFSSSGMKTMVNRGRFLHTVSVGPDVSMGEENSRERVAQLMHRLVGKSVHYFAKKIMLNKKIVCQLCGNQKLVHLKNKFTWQIIFLSFFAIQSIFYAIERMTPRLYSTLWRYVLWTATFSLGIDADLFGANAKKKVLFYLQTWCCAVVLGNWLATELCLRKLQCRTVWMDVATQAILVVQFYWKIGKW